MAVEIFMAKMSDHMETGEIVSWLVSEGDRVEKGQPILEITTDKAVAEVVAEASGYVKGIRFAEGAIVPVGETMAFIVDSDRDLPDLALPVKDKKDGTAPDSEEELLKPLPGAAASARSGDIRATPVARRMAQNLGIDLAQVTGTGAGGRIQEKDVASFSAEHPSPEHTGGRVKATPAARKSAKTHRLDIAAVPGSGPGGRVRDTDVQAFLNTCVQPRIEAAGWIDLNDIQRLTGQRMLESVQQAPQFALTASADMTQVLWLRDALMERIEQESGERLSITAILVKVVAAALVNHPRANAYFDDGRVRLYPSRNIGVAVGADEGLVVPVIKEADKKSLVQVVRELGSHRNKARRMRFSVDDLSGGTFTLSNLGMYGIDHFNAIINPPQGAILAVGRIIKTPVGLPDDTIALRPMMNLTLTVDHRTMDGLQGARFLAEIKSGLEKPFFLL